VKIKFDNGSVTEVKKNWWRYDDIVDWNKDGYSNYLQCSQFRITEWKVLYSYSSLFRQILFE